MSVNRIQIRVKPGDKNVKIPLGQTFDELGREHLITEFENIELEDAVNMIQDYETTRYYYGNTTNDNKIYYEFRFFDSVNGNYINGVNFNNADFTDADLYRNKKSFTNSFWKFDYYDTPLRAEQKLMFTIILPTTNCSKYEVPIDPNEDPVAYYQQQAQGIVPPVYDVWEPKVELAPVRGKDESYYIHWMKKRDLFEMETFYMSCKFFNAKTGEVVRFLNDDPTGNNGPLEPTQWFYYQVDLDINQLGTPKYNYVVREFNNAAYTMGVVLGEKGMDPIINPIRWYEYII